MMAGTEDNLLNRISKVATHITLNSSLGLNEVKGALAIFCGGCMLAIKVGDAKCKYIYIHKTI
jgi:hypothetical protein